MSSILPPPPPPPSYNTHTTTTNANITCNGQSIAVKGLDGRIRILKKQTGELALTLVTKPSTTTKSAADVITMTHDHVSLLYADVVQIYSLSRGVLSHTLQLKSNSTGLTSDVNRVYVSTDSRILVYDPLNGKLERKLKAHHASDVSVYDNQLVTLNKRKLRWMDALSGAKLAKHSIPCDNGSVTVVDDRALVANGCELFILSRSEGLLQKLTTESEIVHCELHDSLLLVQTAADVTVYQLSDNKVEGKVTLNDSRVLYSYLYDGCKLGVVIGSFNSPQILNEIVLLNNSNNNNNMLVKEISLVDLSTDVSNNNNDNNKDNNNSSSNSNSKKKRGAFATMMDEAEANTNVTDLQTNKRAKTTNENAADDTIIDEDDNGVSIAERLQTLTSELYSSDYEDDDGEEGAAKSVPKAESLVLLLRQALTSSDSSQMEIVLKSGTKRVVDATVAALEPDELLDFIACLAFRISKKPPRASEILIWINAILSQHSEILMAENIVGKMAPLKHLLTERTKNLNDLLKLQGRLNLIGSVVRK